MKPCKIYNTKTYDVIDAVLVDGSILIQAVQKTEDKPQTIEVVYITEDGSSKTHSKRLPEHVEEALDSRQPQKVIDGTFYYTPNDATWWSRTECDGGLVQFEIDGKWGFCKNDTGEIIIDPVWDFAGPFSDDFAMVSIGCNLSWWRKRSRGLAEVNYEGGKWGFIDLHGHVALPLEYDMVKHCQLPGFFSVGVNDKWGMVDEAQNVIVPFSYVDVRYERDLKCIVALTQVEKEEKWFRPFDWTLYDTNGRLIVENLSHRPEEYCHGNKGRYFILRRRRRCGVMQESGKLIAEPSLLKRDAIVSIHKFEDEIR